MLFDSKKDHIFTDSELTRAGFLSDDDFWHYNTKRGLADEIEEERKRREENRPSRKSIYVITVFEDIEEDLHINKRAVGFYHELKNAREALEKNVGDMYESFYNYAVIEEVVPGIYPDCYPRWFYQYNKKTFEYENIEEPETLKHLYGFGIG